MGYRGGIRGILGKNWGFLGKKTAKILFLGLGWGGGFFLKGSQLFLLKRSHAFFCQQVVFSPGNRGGKPPPQHRSMYCGR
ncbi:hypothetical protein CWI56_09650, partial [Neisseria meningitidis]